VTEEKIVKRVAEWQVKFQLLQYGFERAYVYLTGLNRALYLQFMSQLWKV